MILIAKCYGRIAKASTASDSDASNVRNSDEPIHKTAIHHIYNQKFVDLSAALVFPTSPHPTSSQAWDRASTSLL